MSGTSRTPVRSVVSAEFLLSRRFVLWWSVLFSLFIYGYATKGTFDPWTIGTFWPGHFFSAQADAMLQGRLWIDESYLPGECFILDGRCYGYFGLFPSLLRLPFVPVLGIERSEMTAVFLSIAAGIAIWAALDLCRKVLSRESATIGGHSAGYMVVAAVVLGPGGALVLVTDAYVYQEAIMWSIAATMVGVNLFWRWWNDRRDVLFIGATIAFVIAASSRPSTVFVGLFLASALVARRLRLRRLSVRSLLGAIGMALLPILCTVGAFEAKFGSPLPPDEGYRGLEYTYIKQVIENNGGEFGTSLRFVPTAALTYLRPDAVRLSGDWPWVRIRFGRPYGRDALERVTYLPPLADDSINVEPTASLGTVMPLPLVATVVAVAIIVRRRRDRIDGVVLVALATIPLVMMTTQTIASRYLGDFFPLLAAGTAFGAGGLARFRRSGWRVQYVVTLAVLLLAAVSVPVVTILASQYNWTYRGDIQ